jgi:YihY family inner membrane protein
MAESLHKSRNGVSLLSLLILTWCSIRFFQVLVQGVNRAWHRVDIPWWKLPLKNLLMMGVLASALGIGLFAPVVLQAAGKLFLALEALVQDQVPTIKFHMITLILTAGRYLVAGGLTFYALSALYVLAPGRKIFFKQIWGAALMVTLALQVGQGLFGNYVAKIVNYNAIYGPFGALMLALMWVYIAGGLILLGACFCAAAEQGEPDEEITPSNSEN